MWFKLLKCKTTVNVVHKNMLNIVGPMSYCKTFYTIPYYVIPKTYQKMWHIPTGFSVFDIILW